MASDSSEMPSGTDEDTGKHVPSSWQFWRRCQQVSFVAPFVPKLDFSTVDSGRLGGTISQSSLEVR